MNIFLCAARLRWLPVLLLGSMLLVSTASAAKLSKERVMHPELVSRMTALNGVVVLPQESPAILVVDPRMGMGPNFSVALVSNPGITSGTFVGGAAAGLAGALISSAVVEGQWQSLRDEVVGPLYALNTQTAWDTEHTVWISMLRQTLRDELGVAATLDAAHTPVEGSVASLAACAEGDSCLAAVSRWGLSADARHLETHVHLMIWSPELRKAGKKPRRVPDYANQLVYRSAMLELGETKSGADRAALRDVAMQVYRGEGVADLIKIANDKQNPDARDARRKANLLLRQHRRRIKDAERSKWTDEAQVVRRALAWSDADGRRIREELMHASADIAAMLKLELSADGQSAKTTGKFKSRDAQAVAAVMREGKREWVYLNDGTLVSRVAGDGPPLPWNHALELKSVVAR